MITKEEFHELDLKVDKLNLKLNAIYELLKSNQSTQTKEYIPIVPNATKIVNLDKVPKSTINWDGLNKISDGKVNQIVQTMYMNNYPTVTSGQFKLLSDIASRNNIKITI